MLRLMSLANNSRHWLFRNLVHTFVSTRDIYIPNTDHIFPVCEFNSPRQKVIANTIQPLGFPKQAIPGSRNPTKCTPLFFPHQRSSLSESYPSEYTRQDQH
jgi:hypothetical protein